MALVVTYNGKRFSNIVGGKSRGGYCVSAEIPDGTKKVLVDCANFNIHEDDDCIVLNAETFEVEIKEEYGTEYANFEKKYEVPYISYDKNSGSITDFDKEMIERVLCNETFGEWLAKVIFCQNKYMYTIYCGHMEMGGYYGWSMPRTTVINTLRFIQEGTFGQLEAVCKNLGLNFFTSNIGSEDFTLKNAKKFHRAVELPKQVIEFLKDKEFADMLSDFRILCADDPNEGIALVDWFNRYKKMQNLKKGVQNFQRFVNSLVEIKKNNDKVSLHRLLPYLVAQRMYFCWPVEDKFELPYDELRLYRDYLNLGDNLEMYPSCLEAAHNIALRNQNITNNTELCEKFAEVVKPLKALEWVHDGYAIVAPVKAQDFVDEGEALHHCLATYVELVANGSERVMFLRNEATPNESLVTFAFDADYKIVEAKEAFNVDVEDVKMIQVLQDWRKHLKEKEKAEEEKRKKAATV